MNGGSLKIDTAKLREIANNIEGHAQKYDSEISEVYSKFKILGSYWSGKDYDAANSKMTQNQSPLLDLGETSHKIAKSLLEFADKYDELINKSASQFE